jgi:hypothetical protein
MKQAGKQEQQSVPHERELHLKKIKDMYDSFEQFLLKNGRLLARDTGIGYWGVTHISDLYELFTRMEVHKYSHLLDLGSGDGRVVLLASIFGIQATGIECDDWLTSAALNIKGKLALPHFEKVRLLKDDFMKHGMQPYDLVYVSPDKPFFRSLDRKLQKELQGKLIVHGYEFHPGALQLEREWIINGDKFCVYGRKRG